MRYMTTYPMWLRSLRSNPFHPKSSKVMRRRVGRWIRRFERRHGVRSRFRDPEVVKQF
jgi:hypothetical protein